MAKVNPKRLWTTQKIDAEFEKQLREVAKMRYIKGLDKKELKLPEMTRLYRRQPEHNLILDKMKNLPKWEDVYG